MVLTTHMLTGDDVDLWRSLRQEGTRLYPLAFFPTPAEAAAFPIETDRAILDKGGRFGVFADGDCVGIAAMSFNTISRARHRVEIGPVYIRPQAQGTGAADALMRALLAHADDRGAWQQELYVAASDPRAQRFYQRYGFKEVARLPNTMITQDGPQDDLLYIRQTPEQAGTA